MRKSSSEMYLPVKILLRFVLHTKRRPLAETICSQSCGRSGWKKNWAKFITPSSTNLFSLCFAIVFSNSLTIQETAFVAKASKMPCCCFAAGAAGAVSRLLAASVSSRGGTPSRMPGDRPSALSSSPDPHCSQIRPLSCNCVPVCCAMCGSVWRGCFKPSSAAGNTGRSCAKWRFTGKPDLPRSNSASGAANLWFSAVLSSPITLEARQAYAVGSKRQASRQAIARKGSASSTQIRRGR
mmetsp:Transcript_98212/g.283374  ORF Transcript_98212/g.283374 Transcript_98212/m.283374 type:complete len:239 (+) Transcript_98212:1136-1852(+)